MNNHLNLSSIPDISASLLFSQHTNFKSFNSVLLLLFCPICYFVATIHKQSIIWPKEISAPLPEKEGISRHKKCLSKKFPLFSLVVLIPKISVYSCLLFSFSWETPVFKPNFPFKISDFFFFFPYYLKKSIKTSFRKNLFDHNK